MNIATTREQSLRLINCGVDPNTADMLWHRLCADRDYDLYTIPWQPLRIRRTELSANQYPAWSLSALLNLFKGWKGAIEYVEGGLWRAITTSPVGLGGLASCPIEACVKLAERIIDYGYKINNENN